MNENAKKWVEALRSGEYPQTRENLSDSVGYCSLGVACRLYERETGQELPKSEEGLYRAESLDFTFKPVREWLGLEDPDGAVSGSISLVKLNDIDEWTFHQIAEFIESEPEGLFVD